MPTIDQIHRDNLRLLVKEAGNLTSLAEKTGKSLAQLSQWVNASKDFKTGKPRALSRASARDLERAMGKPEGWMDQPHGEKRAAKKGALFEELTDDEKRLLDNFRAMLDDDQNAIADDIANKAAKMRAYTDKLLRERFGTGAKPAKVGADAKRTEIARAALDVTDRLRQQSMFDGEPREE